MDFEEIKNKQKKQTNSTKHYQLGHRPKWTMNWSARLCVHLKQAIILVSWCAGHHSHSNCQHGCSHERLDAVSDSGSVTAGLAVTAGDSFTYWGSGARLVLCETALQTGVNLPGCSCWRRFHDQGCQACTVWNSLTNWCQPPRLQLLMEVSQPGVPGLYCVKQSYKLVSTSQAAAADGGFTTRGARLVLCETVLQTGVNIPGCSCWRRFHNQGCQACVVWNSLSNWCQHPRLQLLTKVSQPGVPGLYCVKQSFKLVSTSQAAAADEGFTTRGTRLVLCETVFQTGDNIPGCSCWRRFHNQGCQAGSMRHRLSLLVAAVTSVLTRLSVPSNVARSGEEAQAWWYLFLINTSWTHIPLAHSISLQTWLLNNIPSNRTAEQYPFKQDCWAISKQVCWTISLQTGLLNNIPSNRTVEQYSFKQYC